MFRRRREAGEGDDEVVPIDCRLGHDFDLLLITGPNTGGKTVALKTIGLVLLMVQAGIPVPVQAGSTIGMFNNVLIDVGDEQSMQQSLSTFSGHLRRLLEMLRRASKRTLVLIDELGAGTDPDEGAAIGRAILDEFLRLETRCIATTHLGALKGYALTRPRAENASVEFDAETLRPTYHLRTGESGSSNAIDVAHRLGMPKRLVVAARRNLSRKAKALRSALQGTAEVKRQAEQAREAADQARHAATEARNEAGAARDRLERQQQDFRTWVQRVVHLQPGDPVRVRNFDRDGRVLHLRLDQQRAEVNVGAFAVEVPLGDLLPPETPAPPARPPLPLTRPAAVPPRKPERTGAGKSRRSPEQTPERRETREQRSPPHQPPPLPPLTEEQAAALCPMDAIYVKRFQREGRVVRLKPGKKEVVVSVGLLEMEVPYDGLALPPKAAGREQSSKPPRAVRRDAHPPSEPKSPPQA